MTFEDKPALKEPVETMKNKVSQPFPLTRANSERDGIKILTYSLIYSHPKQHLAHPQFPLQPPPWWLIRGKITTISGQGYSQ